MNKFKTLLILSVLLLTATYIPSWGNVDSRIRKYISPVKIVWTECPDRITNVDYLLREGNGHAAGDLFDRALFSAACKAAVKAGQRNTIFRDEEIAQKVTKEYLAQFPQYEGLFDVFFTHSADGCATD